MDASDARGMERSSKVSSSLAHTTSYALTGRWPSKGEYVGNAPAFNSVPGTGANGVAATKSMRLVDVRKSAENIVSGEVVCCILCVLPLPYTVRCESF